jgi:hypothetical protein
MRREHYTQAGSLLSTRKRQPCTPCPVYKSVGLQEIPSTLAEADVPSVSCYLHVDAAAGTEGSSLPGWTPRS